MGNDLFTTNNRSKKLVFSHFNSCQTSKSKLNSPEYWASKIQAEPKQETLKELRIKLAGEDLKWIHQFIEASGLQFLLNLLGSVEQSVASAQNNKKELQMQSEVLRCMEKLTNNEVDALLSCF